MVLTKNTHLYELLEKYSKAEEHLGSELIQLQEKVNYADIIVPFLGTQGAGKSTLINALLGEDILPNGADETTCIPVEVRYGDSTSVDVFFKGNQQRKIEIDQKNIADYVDNNFNPGNEKGVDRIVIKKALSILKNGLILVDLPGVGSLTHANEETTTKYIQSLSAAVFLFSTTPPILKKEAAFIKNIWRGVNNAFFVQNVWDDNFESEVEEGLNHNKVILADIAKEINASFDEKLIPVNAYCAAYGRYRKEEIRIKESNILLLENELKNFAVNFKEATLKAFKERVCQVVGFLEDSLEDSIRQLNMNYEDILCELNEKKHFFEEKNDEIKTIARRIDDKIYEERKKIKVYSKELAERKTNLLRTEMYVLIDKGLVDGEKLDSAFSQYQSDHHEEVCNEIYDKLCILCEELQEDYDKLDIELEDIEKQDEVKEKLNIATKLKWEKGMKIGIRTGAGIGGTIAGGAISTAVTGALTGGSVGSAAGPIGAAVGIVVGLAICLIGAGVASLAQKGVTKARGSETKKTLEPVLEEYQEKIEKYVKIYYNQYFDSIKGNVDTYLNILKNQLTQISDEISEIRLQGQNIKYSEDEMRNDLEYVKKWELENE